MKIYYYIHEYSEGAEFPDVYLFTDSATRTNAMIDDAFDAAEDHPEAYITLVMDGEPVERSDIPPTLTGLNIQWSEDGAVDCFRIGEQEI